MKFLCDRCKTRYSIGDERVRGKILKIRCKNCANVITVREGMPDADAVDASAPFRRNPAPTQSIGIVTSDVAAAAAITYGTAASAVTKPPPALEEEWYVSIDGNQAGPFSLAAAQRWVAGKAFEAELYCWSEGFDDWLPVDKVSHFRGLRKKPAPPAAPPPLPRIGGGGSGRVMTATPRAEDEPKPLFAATMASLEKSAGTAAPLPAPRVQHAHVNGLSSARGVPGGGTAATTPLLRNATAQSIAAAPLVAKPFVAKPLVAKPLAAKPLPFDDDPADSETQLEPAPFEDEPQTGEPASARRGHNDAYFDAVANRHDAAIAAAGPDPVDEPDDIDIGEVSRVVKLADIVPRRSNPITKQPAPAAANPMIGRTTASTPKLGGGTMPVPRMDAVTLAPGANGLTNPVADVPTFAATHRRGMIALLIGAAVLLGAAIVIVVVVMGGTREETSLGGEYELNNQRPDQILPRPGEPIGPNNQPIEPPPNPFIPKKWRPPVVKQPDPLPTPSGNSLKADEIEAMANKYSGTTTSCFRRADKGADAILLSDVKKITVSFTVAPDGGVTNVRLSNNSSDKLGRCLTSMIGSWRFRSSPGGNYGFVFAKPD